MRHAVAKSMKPKYDASEQDVIAKVFAGMLQDVTQDGGKKRKKGKKTAWWADESHEAAVFSHLSKWKHCEFRDKDSGTHPLVHLAWRALALAYQDTYDKTDPIMLPHSVFGL